MVTRDMQGRFVLGPRLQELASAAGEDRLTSSSLPILVALRDHTKESAQLFRWQGEHRVCVAAAEPATGLRDSIPVGATLSLKAGSGAQVLLTNDPFAMNGIIVGAEIKEWNVVMDRDNP